MVGNEAAVLSSVILLVCVKRCLYTSGRAARQRGSGFRSCRKEKMGTKVRPKEGALVGGIQNNYSNISFGNRAKRDGDDMVREKW